MQPRDEEGPSVSRRSAVGQEGPRSGAWVWGHAVHTPAEPHKQLWGAVCWARGTQWPGTASRAWDLVTAPRTAGKAGGRRPRGDWGQARQRR